MSLEIILLDNAATLLEINNAAVPDVGAVDARKAAWLTEHAVLPGLAMLDGQIAGLVVVLSDSSGYDSDYYRWFTARYENFLYVDRIVVATWARGRGVATQLYQHIDHTAQEHKLAIVADVYSDPPNTPSLKFHQAMGFREIGTEYMPRVQKTVSKFMKFPEHAITKMQP